jgi:hypothetical protein
MKDPTFQQLLELSWQRSLTQNERAQLSAWLALHPEFKSQWEVEANLNTALETLPQAQVPSNFTARVLQEVSRDAAGQKGRVSAFTNLWRRRPRWLIRAAFAALVLGTGLFSYHQVMAARRADIARNVATVCGVSSMPSPEVLKDFDAIRAMDPSPPADEELLLLFR